MGLRQPNELTGFKWLDNILECRSANGVILRIHVLTDYILRLRYATDAIFYQDFSYAIDPGFSPKKVDCTVQDDGRHIKLETGAVTCKISRLDLSVSFFDTKGRIINEDKPGFRWSHDLVTGNDIVKMSKKAITGERYFGLGDKPVEMDLRGKVFQNWGTDSYGYVKGTDPLYKNIPFYYGLHDGVGYGIFFDNSFRTHFDFGHENPGIASFWSFGGEMNYYFIAGPQLLDVARRYAALTGRPDMPAMWSLGFQQCKWSYYPEKVVRQIAAEMRKNRVPCDAIYLDIDYMDGFRCFTWDHDRFPDPKKMVDDLNDQGFKTVVIIDPGIKKDHEYEVFNEALERGFFCRRPDGPYVEGIVWPGDCYFPDFTNPKVREWWAGLYESLIGDIGVAGVWNDMNEPALFEVETKTFMEDVRHDYDGNPCSHRKAHNVYGMQMARATYEGARRYSNGRRSLVITRSGYAGLQRYSSIWTGDNCATWEHLWLANIQCQRMSISGVSFSGSDVGGFIGTPSPDLMVRWIQLAIFHPFCRVHSSQEDGDQEPWSFGETTLNLFRKAIELRYRLLPYHYTAFYQAHKYGTPILRPLVFYDQLDGETGGRDNEFMCGDHLLVASVTKPGQTELSVYLPKGEWYNYWTNQLSKGGHLVQLELTDATFPFFVRAGAVIPFYPVQQYVGELSFDVIDLHIYWVDGVCLSHIFEDDHEGYEYEGGHFRYSTFKVTGTTQSIAIEQQTEGSFDLPYQHYRLKFIGVPFEPECMVVNGTKIAMKENASEQIKVPIDFSSLALLM